MRLSGSYISNFYRSLTPPPPTDSKSNARGSILGTSVLNGLAGYMGVLQFHSGYVFSLGIVARVGVPNFLKITSHSSASFCPGKMGVLL